MQNSQYPAHRTKFLEPGTQNFKNFCAIFLNLDISYKQPIIPTVQSTFIESAMTKPLPPGAPRLKAKATPGVRKPKNKAIINTKLAAQEKNFAKLRAKAATVGDPAGVSYAAVALRKSDRHLTEMQMMFVRHWAAGESILSASARAGYADSGTYAYRLAKDPAVLKIYEREKVLYEKSCQMTRKRVMDGFLEAADMAKLQADPTAMTGAWREIGKMAGYYEPVRKRIDININGQIVTRRVENMDDEMLLKIIKGEVGAEVIDMELAEIAGDDHGDE